MRNVSYVEHDSEDIDPRSRNAVKVVCSGKKESRLES